MLTFRTIGKRGGEHDFTSDAARNNIVAIRKTSAGRPRCNPCWDIYLKIRPTKKTLVPGPQGDKGRTTHACRPQSRAQPRGAHPGYRRRGRRARQDAQSQAQATSTPSDIACLRGALSAGAAERRRCTSSQKLLPPPSPHPPTWVRRRKEENTRRSRELLPEIRGPV